MESRLAYRLASLVLGVFGGSGGTKWLVDVRLQVAVGPFAIPLLWGAIPALASQSVVFADHVCKCRDRLLCFGIGCNKSSVI